VKKGSDTPEEVDLDMNVAHCFTMTVKTIICSFSGFENAFFLLTIPLGAQRMGLYLSLQDHYNPLMGL
jgi:hypothetical protein